MKNFLSIFPPKPDSLADGQKETCVQRISCILAPHSVKSFTRLPEHSTQVGASPFIFPVAIGIISWSPN